MMLTAWMTLSATAAAASSHEGQSLPALVAEYSDDGQHLNTVGQRRIAEALLTFLARSP